MYVPTKYEMPKIPKVRAKRKIKMEDVFEMTSNSRQERSPHQLRPQTQQPRTQRPYAQKS